MTNAAALSVTLSLSLSLALCASTSLSVCQYVCIRYRPMYPTVIDLANAGPITMQLHSSYFEVSIWQLGIVLIPRLLSSRKPQVPAAIISEERKCGIGNLVWPAPSVPGQGHGALRCALFASHVELVDVASFEF